MGVSFNVEQGEREWAKVGLSGLGWFCSKSGLKLGLVGCSIKKVYVWFANYETTRTIFVILLILEDPT